MLDGLLAAARIAHEVIFDLHRVVIAREPESERASALLRESAAIVVTELPRLTAHARQLTERWNEQELLAPDHAQRAWRELQAELESIEPEVSRRVDRQSEIARELRTLAADLS